MADLDDEMLVRLVRAGRKVECPCCGRRIMSQGYAPFASSGIGQHIRMKHPELEPEVFAASKRMERKVKDAAEACAAEAAARPLRTHTVTGAFLDEIAGELHSLIGMMEPYYSQCDGARDAVALIERIEAMAATA